MKREEHLEFCKKCKNRGFNLKKGIICNITNDIADFELSCPKYEFDETTKRPDVSSIMKKKKSKKEKKKKLRIKEKIKQDDLFILLTISLFATFVFRLISYTQVSYYFSHIDWFSILFLVVFLSLALILRKKEMKQFRFFGDIKYRLIFSFMFGFMNAIYLMLIHEVYLESLYVFVFLVFITFGISFACIILLKPIFYFYSLMK